MSAAWMNTTRWTPWGEREMQNLMMSQAGVEKSMGGCYTDQRDVLADEIFVVFYEKMEGLR